MFCLFFKNKNQNDIDPIFAGRLAAFAVDNNLVIYVGSGYRSYDEQVACYKKSGGYKDTSGNWIGGDGSAAKPGSSWHNFGEAIDISWNGEESSQYIRNLYGHKESTEEQIELIKYGIFKPLTSGNGKKGSLLEEWHIQPIETQKAKVTDRKSFYEAYKSVKLDQLPSAPNVDVNDSITGTNEQSNFQNEGMGKSIIDNLINNTSLGLSKAKKDSMINMAITLLNEGYEPAFVAGVLANILAEGAAGYFESSAYITYPDNEPAYLVYMDENYDFRDKFSGENISQVGIAETYRVLKELKKGGYKGKFGLGSVQWTGGRTMELIKCYIELYGEDYYPTIEESLIAENMMIVKELNGEYYNKRVYQKWKSEYSKNRDSTDAAYGAGIIVCKNYEIPRADSSGTRANNAEKIYKIMMGLK